MACMGTSSVFIVGGGGAALEGNSGLRLQHDRRDAVGRHAVLEGVGQREVDAGR